MIGHIQNRHLHCANKSNHYTSRILILHSSNQNLRRKGPDLIILAARLEVAHPTMVDCLRCGVQQASYTGNPQRGFKWLWSFNKKRTTKIHLKNPKWPINMEEMLILIHNQRHESVFDWHKITAGKDVQQQQLHTSKWDHFSDNLAVSEKTENVHNLWLSNSAHRCRL